MLLLKMGLKETYEAYKKKKEEERRLKAIEQARIETEVAYRLKTAERERQIQERMQQLSQEGKQATGQGGSAVNPTTINVSTGKERDWGSVVMILMAYAIWAIDLSSFLGKPYKGFIFDFSVLRQTNWIGVATSLIVSLFLIYDILASLRKKGGEASIKYLTEMGILWVINSATLATYYWMAFTNPIINFSFLALFGGIAVYIIHRKGFVSVNGLSETFTYSIMVLTYSFFWTMWNWTSNIKALIHVFFITYFMLFYLKKKEDINVNLLYLFTAGFLIADFYGYSLNINIPLTTISFPFVVLVTSFYAAFFSTSRWGFADINGLAWTLIFFSLFVLPQAPYAQQLGADNQARESGGGKELWDSITKTLEAINLKITGRLDVATGGLYSSQVEKNQFEPLGVFLDKVRASQPRFYVDEPVTIWSSIKSRTLSDPASIRFNCYRYGKDNKPIGIIKKDPTTGQEKKDDKEGDIIPDKPFTVYTLEEKDVECTFKQDADPKTQKFQPGTNPITVSAQYNFVTSAYQEVRFIDRKRYQAMIKENLDPLKEFGLANKNPQTIYTNGPVKITVEVQNPITVDLDSALLPNVVIVLENRDKITDKQGKPVGQWQGKIKKIEELAIIVPHGTDLEWTQCSPVPFVPYKKDNCLESCRKTCRETCEDGGGKVKCLADCDDKDPKSIVSRKCDDECTILFRDDLGLGNYQGYQLDVNSEKFKTRDEFKDIGKFTKFGCRLSLKPEVLEEGVDVTRKFIRVRAKYNYLLESTHSISIEQIPTIDPLAGAITDASTLKLDDGKEISLDLIKGLVAIESKGKHCCKTKPPTINCEKDDLTNPCPQDRILTSYGGSIGIMQINNKDPKSVARNQEILEYLRRKGACINVDIYEKNCNILVGIEILKRNYNDFKNGVKEERLKLFCKPDQPTFDGVNLYNLYAGYRGFDAVLRAYNGWGCTIEGDKGIRQGCAGECKGDSACIQRCIAGVVFYVKKVQDMAECIKKDPKNCPDPLPNIKLPSTQESEEYPPTG